MICLIDNHDETQLINKLVELHYDFDSWNHIVKECIITTIKHMGNQETEEDHEKLVNYLYDLDGDAIEEIEPILAEYGFTMEE